MAKQRKQIYLEVSVKGAHGEVLQREVATGWPPKRVDAWFAQMELHFRGPGFQMTEVRTGSVREPRNANNGWPLPPLGAPSLGEGTHGAGTGNNN